MKHEMSPKEELQELKTKAMEIQVRLDFLKMRIGEIQKGTPSTSQWKAFVDAEKCVSCGICRDLCPVGAIVIEEFARVETQTCIGCGRCVQDCPKGAISLRPPGLPYQYQPGSWRRANRQSRRMNYAM